MKKLSFALSHLFIISLHAAEVEKAGPAPQTDPTPQKTIASKKWSISYKELAELVKPDDQQDSDQQDKVPKLLQKAADKVIQQGICAVYEAERGGTLLSDDIRNLIAQQWFKKNYDKITTHHGKITTHPRPLRPADGTTPSALLTLPKDNVAVGLRNGTVEIWEISQDKPVLKHTLGSPTPVSRYHIEKSSVSALAALPNGDLASASQGGFIKIWDATKKNLKHVINTEISPINYLAALPNGDLAVSFNDYEFSEIWDLSKKDPVKKYSLAAHNPVYSMIGLPNGNLVTGTKGSYLCPSQITIWDMSKNPPVPQHTLKYSDNSKIFSMSLLPNGNLLVGIVGRDVAGIVTIDMTGNVIEERRFKSSPTTLAVLPNGFIVAGLCNDSTAYVWDMITNKEYSHLDNRREGTAVSLLATSPSYNILVGLEGYSSLKIWQPYPFTKPDQITLEDLCELERKLEK